MIKICIGVVLTALAFLAIETAYAKVADAGAAGFTVKHSATVNKPASEAYRIFVNQIGDWWDSEHTYSGKSENMSIDLQPNGCFCERLPDKGNIVHMTVIYAQPGRVLRMTGGLGPLQQFAANGVLTVEFKTEGGRTAADFTYTAGGYVPGGFEKLAPLVDGVLAGQWIRYERFANTGKP